MPRRLAAAADERMSVGDLQKIINDKFGAGVMKFADDESLVITRLPSGLLALDCTLRGGFARGRHIELFGGYNVGKSAIAYNHIATTQANGGVASYIDAEGTFDPSFAEKQGVDLSRLALARQSDLENGHRVVDYIEAQLRSGAFDAIWLDSIASLLPKAEQEESIEAPSMGTDQARLMSKAMRKLTAANKTTVLGYINQTRQAVGASAFAKQSVTSGGRAMGFYAATRIEVSRLENIKRPGESVNMKTGEVSKVEQVRAHRVLLRVEKDKTGSARTTEETTLVFDYDLESFDYLEDLLYLGRQYKLIRKSGQQWWLADYSDDKVQGRARMKKMLGTQSLLAEELQEKIESIAYAEPESDDVLDEDAE